MNGAGFDYADGTAVRAYFASWGETESPTDTVKAGAFSFDFSFPSEVCDLGASRPGGGALYIDVDGDGECSVTQDDIFVWTAETRGGNGPYAISPDSSRCHGMNPGTPGTDAYALAAAQHLCPSVGDCLTFCGPEPSTVNGYFVAFCPSPDAGAPDAGKVDSGESDAGPSDAGH